MPAYTTQPGSPRPLGATCRGGGVDFAVYAARAASVELCLFDAAGAETRLPAAGPTGGVWHLRVEGAGAGQRYGWRAHGPYDPARGDRFNPNKLLLDPYARAIEGRLDWRGPVYGYARDRGPGDGVPCDRDDAAYKPRCVVVDDRFDWGGDRPPATAWADTVVYEVHVKGFTRRHPGVPEAQRGTFLGLASDAAIDHLASLGVTAVELMPVHAHVDEPEVSARGLTNYWGYSPAGFFALDERFAVPPAAGGEGAVREFKRMVKRLHAAGIEVILDVVYNHTCEGDRRGPTVWLRGLDDAAYYRRAPGGAGEYADDTGCGNTLDASRPPALDLVLDSLRYWASEMRVDGFRFDLAAALARGPDGAFDPRPALFAAIAGDPALSRVKLVAEPWDLGEGGYRLGAFPAPWAEWNGKFRDTARRFWRGEAGAVADLGYRLTGSSDLFEAAGRAPQASVNFAASHDGLTLRDLVTYARKHNLANGEGDRDGPGDDVSQNCGVEGETGDPRVLARRRTLARSLLATVFVSLGVPMLQMGDEMRRTQRGNDNAYCHDSELTWIDWDAAESDPAARAMRDLAASLAALRRRCPALRRAAFLRGAPEGGGARKDVTWLRADGAEMTLADWERPARARLALHLAPPPRGGAPEGGALVVLMNGDPSPAAFTLPPAALGAAWRVAVDTGEPPRIGAAFGAASGVALDAGALVVLEEA